MTSRDFDSWLDQLFTVTKIAEKAMEPSLLLEYLDNELPVQQFCHTQDVFMEHIFPVHKKRLSKLRKHFVEKLVQRIMELPATKIPEMAYVIVQEAAGDKRFDLDAKDIFFWTLMSRNDDQRLGFVREILMNERPDLSPTTLLLGNEKPINPANVL